jgi:hypothetical protein
VQRKRRSGRIAKEIAIVLLGTDTTGKMFSEETKTVVLSRHGAGVVSRYRFSPDELLTLRLPDSNKEAEIRFVGQIGGEPGRYVYGVAFVDPDPHFWPMEFAPPESFESASSFILLECSLCQATQNVEQHEIEEDVYSVNGNILRFCENCGSSTPWKKSADEAVLAPAANPAKPPFRLPASSSRAVQREVGLTSFPIRPKPNLSLPPPSPGLRSLKPVLGVPAFAASFEPVQTASAAPAPAESLSSYSGTSTISEFAARSDVPLADIPASFAIAGDTAVLQAPEPGTAPAAKEAARPASRLADIFVRELDRNGRPVNKRRHVRIRVSFSACVRHAAHADEVVECENVSKGGVCFHSLQQYELESLIQLAAPFSPGETALFVPGRIKRVEALSGGQVFRYGVEYVKRSSAAPTI